jgi:hypothetical protein
MRWPTKTHGEVLEQCKPIAVKWEHSFSNHNFGARRKPYKERIKRQYVPGVERGQPLGGFKLVRGRLKKYAAD